MESQRATMYRKMLLDVGDEVNKDDSFLEAMKFYCSDIVKMKDRQHIKSALQLWTFLEQRDYLREDKTDFLKELLKHCMRNDVTGLHKVEQYERDIGMIDVNRPPVPPQQNYQAPPVPQQQHYQAPYQNMNGQQQVVYVVAPPNVANQVFPDRAPIFNNYRGPDLSREIKYLETRLGRHWMFYIRELGICDAEIEQISLDQRTVRERIHRCLLAWQDKEQENASREKLIVALQGVQRNDLVEAFLNGTF